MSTRRVVSSQTTFGTRTDGVVGEVLGEGLGVGGLGEVVDLLERGRRELLDQRTDVRALRDGLVALEPSAHAPERGQVHVDDLVDVGPLHLHDHVREPHRLGFLGTQMCSMHLAERGGRKRRLVDPVVALHERSAELGLGLRPDRLEGDRRDFVLEPGELVGDHGRKHVEARREELAHLDHEPAHAHGQGAEAYRDLAGAVGARAIGPCRRPILGKTISQRMNAAVTRAKNRTIRQ